MKELRTKVLLKTALASALAASMPLMVQAQTDTWLEEVVVTAQKRVQSLQDVPISVATLSGERMDAIFSDGSDILALGVRVPGLYAESSNGRASPRFYIRGLGNADFDLAASQPVSIIMDEVVMENVVLKSFPLFDVSQVEVIRGPQGTLFGRNTTAGIVKFDTEKPTEETEGFAKVTMGSLGTKNLEAAVGGSLVEGVLSARVSVLSQNRDDWIDNGFTGEGNAMGGFEEKAFRAQALWTPTDNFSALLSYQERELDGTSSIFRGNIFTKGKNGLNSNFDRDKVYFDGGNNNPQGVDGSGTNLKIIWDLENITVTSITSFQDAESSSLGDIDGGAVLEDGSTVPQAIPFDPDKAPNNFVTQDEADADQFTQEIRISSNNDGAMNWQVGGFYYDSELDATITDGFFGATTFTQENTTWALFAQATYDVSDQLTLTGGVRYTDDEKSLHVGDQNVDGFALVIGFASIQDYEDVNVSDDQMSWEFSANYTLDDDSSVYARVANGFRAQSIQARDVAFEGLPSVADSETINSFEVGYKADLMDGRSRVNVGAFYYVIDDLQLSAIGGANNGNSLLNADEGVGYGLEVDLEFAVTEHLLLTAGYSYAKTELKESGLSTAPCGSQACTPTDPFDADGNVIIDGNPFQTAPETTFNFSARYSVPVESGEVYFYTDWALQGETNMALYESVEFQTDNQFEGGLRLGFINTESNYELAVFGRNITDEENIKGFIDFSNNTGFVNDPSTWGVDFRVDF